MVGITLALGAALLAPTGKPAKGADKAKSPAAVAPAAAPAAARTAAPNAPEPSPERAANTLVVLNLKAVGVNETDALGLTLRLAEIIGATTSLRVSTVDEINDAATLQKNLRTLGCEDEACIAELSKVVNARLVLSGSLGRVGEGLVLSLSLLDVVDQRAVGSGSRTVADLDAAVEVLPALVAEVFGTSAAVDKVRYSLPGDRDVSFAVFDLKPLGISAEMATNLTQVLAVEIKKIERTRVVSRDDVTSMLELEANKSSAGCDGMSCLAEIGGALGVEKLLVGSAGKVGGGWLISLRLIDTKSMNVESRLGVTFHGVEEQLLTAVRFAGRQLLGVESTDAGTLALSSSEGQVEVFVDGKSVGLAPMPPLVGLAAGKHAVQLKKEGFIDWSSDVFIAPADTTPVWAAMNELPPPWYRTWWFWTATGAVLVGAGVAIAVAVANAATTGDVAVDYTVAP